MKASCLMLELVESFFAGFDTDNQSNFNVSDTHRSRQDGKTICGKLFGRILVLHKYTEYLLRNHQNAFLYNCLYYGIYKMPKL